MHFFIWMVQRNAAIWVLTVPHCCTCHGHWCWLSLQENEPSLNNYVEMTRDAVKSTISSLLGFLDWIFRGTTQACLHFWFNKYLTLYLNKFGKQILLKTEILKTSVFYQCILVIQCIFLWIVQTDFVSPVIILSDSFSMTGNSAR